MTPATRLENPITFRKTVTSQWGEDGIIAEIFRRIGTCNRHCVEFGAWDGEYLSNTWDLWHNQEWSSTLIEADEARANVLRHHTDRYPKVQVLNRFVAANGENALEQILSQAGVPATLDLISIDVDGDDYYLFESLTEFRPRVVIVEYNPTVPPHLDLVQVTGEYFGASALALTRLANAKGYGLVGCTESNCVFVFRSEYAKLEISEPPLTQVFPTEHLTYIITAQDGAALLSRHPTYTHLKQPSRFGIGRGPLRRKRNRHPRLIGTEQPIPIDLKLVSGGLDGNNGRQQ